MDIVIDGVDYATRFPGKPETGHAGQSFDHAADTHGAPAPHAAAPADKSWWDSAVDGVKSAAGSADSAIHSAGAAVDHAAESGINSATSAVRSVAGDRAANLVHGAAEAVHDNVKQSVGFTYGVGAGATEALGGMVEGTGNLVKTGAKLATDPAFRSQVAQGAKHLAQHVAADPVGTAKSLGTGAVHAGQDWMRGAGKAAQEGNLGEYLGHATGSAAVNVGSFFIPGAGEADAANLASHLGQAAETATTATHALQAGSEAATTAARAERALGGAEHAAGTAEKAVNAGEHTAASATRTVSATVGRNEATWTLGADGRPTHVEGVLRESSSGLKRSGDELRAQGRVTDRAGVQTDDHAGHIVGHRFTADQGERNMFPQNGNFNTSAYKTMENEWESWTKAGGEVHFKVDLKGGSADRPDQVVVNYEVRNSAGQPVYDNRLKFDNRAGQTFERVPTKDMANLLK